MLPPPRPPEPPSFRRDPKDDGADHISALHDDVLLQILAGLGCIHAAARTDLLSRRWRGLWTRLPELVLGDVTPGSLDAVLAHLVARFGTPQAPPLQPPVSLLDVRALSYMAFASHQISSLFDAAAALQPADLVVHIVAVSPCVVMLPRLDRTKSITLDVHNISLLPPQDQGGDMPALESLSLSRYLAVLPDGLRRFSALRSLSVSNLCQYSFVINLPVLEELFLSANVRLRQVVISAPMLKKLTFNARAGVANDCSLLYLAPKVVDLSWQCTTYLSHVCFGGIWSPMMVTIKTSEPLNMFALSLDIEEGREMLFIQDDDEDAPPSFVHYISSLFPFANNFCSALELRINSCGHVYGAMVLQLLEVYTLIEILKVDLRNKFQCIANCPCFQLNNWRNQTIRLAHLKEVQIKGVWGEDYEIDMLKVILRSAAMLERVAFTFSLKSEQRVRRFSSKIHSILKAHPSVQCKIYRCSGEQVLSA